MCLFSVPNLGLLFLCHRTSVFKIYNIDKERHTFTERINLKSGKNKLTYSSNDIAWNPVDDRILATGATNGHIVVWDLNRPAHPKTSGLFKDHERTINTVNFHPSDVNLLVSGSQDGTMRLFDLRSPAAINTFSTNSTSVRDLQFSPHHHNGFQVAAVLENGNVQIWDSGKVTSPLHQFTAHNGPVFTVDWHPTHGKWLATGGRDKMIKIWDLENKDTMEYSIQTIAPVARIRWRPEHKFQIASSSLVVDFSVSVWDIRRPYIPYALFTEHKDVTRGFVWINEGAVLSAGKDNTLYHHYFEDSVKPMEQANPMAVDISNPGDAVIAHRDDSLKLTPVSPPHRQHSQQHHHRQPSHQGSLVVSPMQQTCLTPSAASSLPSVSPLTSSLPPLVSEQTHNGATASSSQSSSSGSNRLMSTARIRLSSMFHKSSSSSSQYQRLSVERDPLDGCHSSLLCITDIAALSMDWFLEFANCYQLTGRSFDDLCENNADVAYRLGRIAICNAWKIVKERYGLTLRSSSRSDVSNDHRSDRCLKTHRILSQVVNSSVMGPLRHVNGNSCSLSPVCTDSEASDFIDQSDSDDSYVNIQPVDDMRRAEVREAENAANFFFGDSDWSTFSSSLSYTTLMTRQESASTSPPVGRLPDEAFELRFDIPDYPTPPIMDLVSSSLSPPKVEAAVEPEPVVVAAVDEATDAPSSEPDKGMEQVIEMLFTHSLSLPKYRSMIRKDERLIEKILRSFASEGDVQSCVSLLIVLGDRMKGLQIDDLTQEKWFTAYVELLYRFQLWSVATQVISLSHIPNVNSLNQTSTNVNLCCGNCGKLNHGTGPFVCKSCNTQTCICCICNELVYGLYAWCEGCSHGGHLLHLKHWYDSNSRCPAGCGHECEYAATR